MLGAMLRSTIAGKTARIGLKFFQFAQERCGPTCLTTPVEKLSGLGPTQHCSFLVLESGRVINATVHDHTTFLSNEIRTGTR